MMGEWKAWEKLLYEWERMGRAYEHPTPASVRRIPWQVPTCQRAQARFPVTSKPEMRGHVYAVGESNAELRNRLEARLRNEGASAGEINTDPDGDSINNWVNLFETVYPSTTPATEIITFDRIAEAIATYEQSQVFVNNAWKRYVQGTAKRLPRARSPVRFCFTEPPRKAVPGAWLATPEIFSRMRDSTLWPFPNWEKVKAMALPARMTSAA